MGSTNQGTQVKVFDFEQMGTSQGFNLVNYKLIPQGVYSGYTLTVLNTTTVGVSTGVAYIADQNGTCGVRVTTSVGIDLTPTPSTSLIVLRMTWVNSVSNNYADFLCIANGSQLSTDIILGEATFTGSDVTGIDSTLRDVASLATLDLNKGTAASVWSWYEANLFSLITWISTKTYSTNDIVAYGGYLYKSLQNSNTNQNPVTATTYWAIQVGGITWNSSATYATNDIVNYNGTLYVSLQNSNTNQQPDTATTYWVPYKTGILWNSLLTYNLNDIVNYGGILYKSLQASNINQQPYTATTYWTPIGGGITWNSAVTYGLSDIANYNGILYSSIQTSNTNNNPATAVTYWQPFINSAESLSRNYIEDGTFENQSIANYVVYNDGASATPVDGTGGTPSGNLSIAINTTTPLFSGADALITKSAFNTQGEGVGKNFTIDRGAIGQVHSISFYLKTGGSYASNDVGVYIYDVTNSSLIPTSLVNVAQGSNPDRWFATFIPSTSTSYRLILHVQSTNASAWTLEIDNVSVGPYEQVVGAAIGPPTSFTSVITTSATNPTKGTYTETAIFRRVGKFMEVDWEYVQTASGSAGSGNYRLAIPNGKTIDSSLYQGSYSWVVGECKYSDGGGNIEGQVIVVPGDGFTFVEFLLQTGFQSVDQWGSAIGPLSGPTFSFSAHFRVPIAQWSDNINLANNFQEFAFNTDTSLNDDTTSFGYGSDGIAFANFDSGYGSAITGATSKVVSFKRPIQPTDTISIEVYVVGAGWLKLSEAGWTIVEVAHVLASNSVVGMGYSWRDSQSIWLYFGKSGRAQAISGTGTQSWGNLLTGGYKWRIRKISGGNSAEVPPVVRAEYQVVSPTSIPASTFTVLSFASKIEDTHSAYNTTTGEFVAPIDGVYLAKIALQINSGFSSSVNANAIYTYINGTLWEAEACVALRQFTTLRLRAGDKLTFKIYVSTSGTLTASAAWNYAQFTRIGS